MKQEQKKIPVIIFLRLGRFKREVRKLAPIEIPDSIRKAAEAKGYKFTDFTS